MKTVTSFRVAAGDTDFSQGVFYPTYIRWFDCGKNELLRALSIRIDPSDTKLRIEGTASESFLIVQDFTCSVLAKSKFDDYLELHTILKTVGESSIKLEFNLFNKQQETLLVRGELLLMHVDPSGSIVPITEDLRKRLESGKLV
jgi:acyl-CoA thioester hydrolase